MLISKIATPGHPRNFGKWRIHFTAISAPFSCATPPLHYLVGLWALTWVAQSPSRPGPMYGTGPYRSSVSFSENSKFRCGHQKAMGHQPQGNISDKTGRGGGVSRRPSHGTYDLTGGGFTQGVREDTVPICKPSFYTLFRPVPLSAVEGVPGCAGIGQVTGGDGDKGGNGALHGPRTRLGGPAKDLADRLRAASRYRTVARGRGVRRIAAWLVGVAEEGTACFPQHALVYAAVCQTRLAHLLSLVYSSASSGFSIRPGDAAASTRGSCTIAPGKTMELP